MKIILYKYNTVFDQGYFYICLMLQDNQKDSKEIPKTILDTTKPSVNPNKTEPVTSEKIYTEAELLKAIEYACQYQKACDYQTAGRFLIVDDSELHPNSVLLLDELCTDESAFSEIEIKDIFE